MKQRVILPGRRYGWGWGWMVEHVGRRDSRGESCDTNTSTASARDLAQRALALPTLRDRRPVARATPVRCTARITRVTEPREHHYGNTIVQREDPRPSAAWQGKALISWLLEGRITGAGVAVDAAARGFKVGLVEKDDFASGTSSKSTKLVHGGIRYLPQYDFALVREALVERGLPTRNAPFLVQPLGFVLPIYSDAKRPLGTPIVPSVRHRHELSISGPG